MKFLNIAKITNTHGIKGELKVDCFLLKYESFFTSDQQLYFYDNSTYSYEQLTVIGSRKHKNNLLVRFNEYNNINDVLFLKNQNLFLLTDDHSLLNPEEDANYLGFKIIDVNDNKVIGCVVDYFNTKAHGIYVINTLDDQQKLLADVTQFIVKIDDQQKNIYVNLSLLGSHW